LFVFHFCVSFLKALPVNNYPSTLRACVPRNSCDDSTTAMPPSPHVCDARKERETEMLAARYRMIDREREKREEKKKISTNGPPLPIHVIYSYSFYLLFFLCKRPPPTHCRKSRPLPCFEEKPMTWDEYYWRYWLIKHWNWLIDSLTI